MNNINILDLFAGCGGLTEGFKMHDNYRFLAAVEWDKSCCNTLSNRLETRWNIKNAKNRVLNFDIQRLDELYNGWENDYKYGTHLGLDHIINKEKVDLIVGGPPCQAYSVAGRIRDKDGMNTDYRNFLFETYVKIVNKYKPDAFIFENVVGILSAKPGGISIIDRISQQFSEAGYHITTNLRKVGILNVADFGVPQNRKRVIIYGVNKFKYSNYEHMVASFYNSLEKLKIDKRTTVSNAISDLEKFFPQKKMIVSSKKKFSHVPTELKDKWHYPRYHSERDISIFKLLADDIKSGNFKYTNSDKIKELYSEITGKSSNVHKYYVLREDKPSNTITAHLHKDGLRHIHPDPEQARTITVREAARLQSFPDDFDFLGSQSDAYKMIGNAVPPLFAHKIAIAVASNIR